MSDYSHGKEHAKVKALRAGMPEYERDLADEMRRRVRLPEYQDELRRATMPVQTLPTMTTTLQGAPRAQAPIMGGGMPDHSPEALPVTPPRPERPSPMPDVSVLANRVPPGAFVGNPTGGSGQGQPSLQDLLQPNRDVTAALGQ